MWCDDNGIKETHRATLVLVTFCSSSFFFNNIHICTYEDDIIYLNMKYFTREISHKALMVFFESHIFFALIGHFMWIFSFSFKMRNDNVYIFYYSYVYDMYIYMYVYIKACDKKNSIILKLVAICRIEAMLETHEVFVAISFRIFPRWIRAVHIKYIYCLFIGPEIFWCDYWDVFFYLIIYSHVRLGKINCRNSSMLMNYWYAESLIAFRYLCTMNRYIQTRPVWCWRVTFYVIQLSLLI